MKKGVFFLIALWGVSLPFGAEARSVAPPMFGVSEVVVDFPLFADSKTSAQCGLAQAPLQEALIKAFAGTVVPALREAEAKPTRLDVARIHLVPTITTYRDKVLGCVSWLSLVAQSEAAVVVPPVSVPRGVIIVYWQARTRVRSSQSVHGDKVSEKFAAVAQTFVRQYQIDHPMSAAP